MNRRPRLESIAPSASADEVAAIMAALERFLRDHAPLLLAGPERPGAWLRTALLEGVDRDPDGLTAWGDPPF